MNYVLVFRPEVREELNEAYDWYENQQTGLGDDFLDSIDEVLNRICQMPESYSIVYRDVRRSVVRRFPVALVFNIVIFNTDDNQCLNILGDCINQRSYKTTLILSLNFIILLSAIFLTAILFKARRSPLRAILSIVQMSVLERFSLSIETLVITLTRIIALFGREG